MQPPSSPIAQPSSSLCAACRAPFLSLAETPHAASQDWSASPVPAASHAPLHRCSVRAYAALHGMNASLKCTPLQPICDISSPKLLNRAVSSRLNINGLCFPCPIRKAMIICQRTQKGLWFSCQSRGVLAPSLLQTTGPVRLPRSTAFAQSPSSASSAPGR